MITEGKAKVLIVDDHELIRVGLKRVLLDAEVAGVVEEAGNARTALELVQREAWDLVVLDLSLPDSDGLEVLKQLKSIRPTTPILVLTILPEEQVSLRVLRAGADGFLPKGSAARDLVGAAKAVLRGGKYVSSGVAAQLIESLRADGPTPPHATLSDREHQVFRGIVEGMTVTEIAAKMKLSVKTISSYRANALRKLNLENNAQLVSYAHRRGLV